MWRARGHITGIATTVLLAAAPVAAGDWVVTVPYEDPESVAAGAQIYDEYCAACHGDGLEGAPDWQTRDSEGYLPAPPHDASGHTWHHPDTQLFVIVKHGIEQLVGGNYKSRMEGYEEILSDEEILQVLAYIKAQWPARVIATHNRINADALAADD